jgi:hypothetical protein
MSSDVQRDAVAAANAARGRRGRKRKGPSCETCFFGRHGLCALELGGPCATFRPDTPSGLLPPRQPALLLREPGEQAIAA